MGKCPKCRKGLGFFGVGFPWESNHFHTEWNGQKLHAQCLTQETKKYCEKFGFVLKDGREAEKCTSYITGEDYKTKALRGEIRS